MTLTAARKRGIFIMEFILANAGDGLDSVVALSKLNGSTVEVVERYEYDAFGQTTIYNEPKTQTYTESQYGNPYTFTGRRLDVLGSNSLLLMCYRYRTYDPYTGRFLQQDLLGVDPVGEKLNPFNPTGQYQDGANTYEYVYSDPVTYWDPLGLKGKTEPETPEEPKYPGDGMEPPGDCTQKEYGALDLAQDLACAKPFSCKKIMLIKMGYNDKNSKWNTMCQSKTKDNEEVF